jgi:hypothetical protein
MATSDLELIPRAVAFTLEHTAEARAKVHEALQTSGATPLVTALRMMTMQQAIVAIGALQVFESVLQQTYGWKDAFPELDAHLRRHGKDDLADRFVQFKDAMNVLKHGAGKSYERLLAKAGKLPFKVKPKDEAFFSEGNVSEVTSLIEPTPEFVESCAKIIEEVIAALAETSS